MEPQEQTSSNTPEPVIQKPEQNLNNKVIFILPVMFILIILIGVGAYLIGKNNKNQMPSVSSSLPTPTPTPVLSPTSQLNISSNQKISFLKDQNLEIADANGENNKIIYNLKPNDQYFTWDWSPDNRKFVTSAGFIIDIDTKQQTQIPSGRCHDWSPDGKEIAYEASGQYLMDSDGKNVKQVSASGGMCRGGNDVHHWLSDSSAFLYTDLENIYRYDLATGKSMMIYDSSKLNIDALNVSVSSDGKSLVFVGRTRYDQSHPDVQSIADIYIASTDGSNLQKLTNLLPVDEPGDSYFTPDGKQILFSVNNLYSKLNGLNRLNIADKTVTNISSEQSDAYFPLSISSDGRFVAYNAISDNVLQGLIVDLQSLKKIILPYKAENILWSR